MPCCTTTTRSRGGSSGNTPLNRAPSYRYRRTGWCPKPGVTISTAPRTIHDFGGFLRELYQVQYPAPSDPALARRVQQMVAPIPVSLDNSWGLDHGTWSVLRHVYPAAPSFQHIRRDVARTAPRRPTLTGVSALRPRAGQVAWACRLATGLVCVCCLPPRLGCRCVTRCRSGSHAVLGERVPAAQACPNRRR
jgi:hypothetical protein